MLKSYARWGLRCACERLVSVNNMFDGATEDAGLTSTTVASKASGTGDVFVPLLRENNHWFRQRKKGTDTGVPGLTEK